MESGEGVSGPTVEATLSLGSNPGPREEHLEAARGQPQRVRARPASDLERRPGHDDAALDGFDEVRVRLPRVPGHVFARVACVPIG